MLTKKFNCVVLQYYEQTNSFEAQNLSNVKLNLILYFVKFKQKLSLCTQTNKNEAQK